MKSETDNMQSLHDSSSLLARVQGRDDVGDKIIIGSITELMNTLPKFLKCGNHS